jgi:hypothetical protein
MLLQQPLHSSLHGVPQASLTPWLISHPGRMLLAASKHKHVSLEAVILMVFLLMFIYSAVLYLLKPKRQQGNIAMSIAERRCCSATHIL